MDPRLLDYYNRELGYIRELGGEFAHEFPKIAGRLGLDEFECADPYVERLLEGFAFLAARVHLKLDAEFPKFTDHLLEMVYPHYLCPLPSMAVVQFAPDHQEGSLGEGYVVPRHTALYSQLGPGDQTPCEYRTSQDVTLWPIEITAASYVSRETVTTRLPSRFKDARALVRIRLQSTAGIPFDHLPMDHLDIFLRGRDPRTLSLYEQLFASSDNVVVAWEGNQGAQLVALERAVQPLGFDDQQGLLPSPPQSFEGYRLLNEYFAFQQRFLFFRVIGLQAALRRCPSTSLELLIPLSSLQPRLENAIDASSLGLFCTPAINLFPHRADRIHLNSADVEFHVVPDRTRPMDYEVHSIVKVTGYNEQAEPAAEFQPFYQVNNWTGEELSGGSRYYSVHRTRRLLSSKQRRKGPRSSYVGSETYLSIVDSGNAPYAAGLSQLDVQVMCTNRDLPLLMPIGKLQSDFTLQSGAPVTAIRVVAGPTEPRASLAAAAGDRSWRLISQLGLNYLSLVSGEDGRGVAALRELLELYVDPHDAASTRQVDGLVGVDSRPIVRRVSQSGPLTFGRGLEITLTCDESRFEGSRAFLLAAVLSDFFSKYVSINSFTQTVLRTVERGEVMRWPANIGKRPIL